MYMQGHRDSLCKIIKYVTKYKGIEPIGKVRSRIFIQTNYGYSLYWQGGHRKHISEFATYMQNSLQWWQLTCIRCLVSSL